MSHLNKLPKHHMTAIVFDTLAYAEKLEAAGFTAEQAKGQAHALREIIDNQIATKQDIASLDASITAKLADAKAELIKWVVGTMFAMTALFVGVVKFAH
ncbi:hypothetical protein GCM10010985_61160 [Caballeronia grimmiae]|uniref:DUF1640 domain-containing protein n=2 Tax=Caballeronia grimmiae TaxID=1071679 RepID=A0ABQ1SA82_9BURK|nr:hypothetical protein GCM10010985_61160 [Caballeronia grimmiae]